MEELNCWEFLKDTCEVWCINLVTRPDRLENVKKQFKKIGILHLVQFHITEKYQGDVIQKGCWDSHRYCLEKAYNNNKNILIFEDDACFIDKWFESYENIKKYYVENNWDILRLGAVVFKYDKEINDNLWCGDLSASHALFINNRYIKKCLNDPNFFPEKYKTHGVDEYYRFECEKDYIIVPPIAYQDSLTTDNIWYKNYTIWQKIWQHKYLYKYNQYLLNLFSWILRNRNDKIKRLNIYTLLFDLEFYFYQKK